MPNIDVVAVITVKPGYEEGWVRTGDLGLIDDDGRVHSTGRCKDVIIRNAENISTDEIEGILLRHPRVVDAAMIGGAG
jgi:cyclohexanecarboxylate-CoA ligase